MDVKSVNSKFKNTYIIIYVLNFLNIWMYSWRGSSIRRNEIETTNWVGRGKHYNINIQKYQGVSIFFFVICKLIDPETCGFYFRTTATDAQFPLPGNKLLNHLNGCETNDESDALAIVEDSRNQWW